MEYFIYSLAYSWPLWIVLIGIIIYTVNTRASMRRLVARIELLERRKPEPVQMPAANFAPHTVPQPPAGPLVTGDSWEAPAIPAAQIDAESAFSIWLRENWLLKAGALLIILAVSWFVNYAFVHNWIGPVGRITLGLLLGSGLLIVGAWRMRRYANQGSIFLVLGSSTILLTTYAARAVYGFFTPESALALMFASVVFVALMSVIHRLQSLAVVSLFMAYITPQLTYAAVTNDVQLFAYLFIVAIGSVTITAITGWRHLTPTAIVLTGLYSMPYISGYAGPAKYTLLIFAYAFATLFFITAAASTLYRARLEVKGSVTDNHLDVYTPILNGAFLLFWIMGVVPEVWQSLSLSAWMVVFLVAAYAVFRRTGEQSTFYAYAAVGVVYLAVATAAELSGNALSIAYAIEVGVLVCLTRIILNNLQTAELLSYLFIGPMLMSLPSLASPAWESQPINEDFFVLTLLAIVMALTGVVLKSGYLAEGRQNSTIGKALIIIGTVYGYAIIWLVLHAGLFPDGLATGICLGFYTIVGIVTYLYGQNNNRPDIVTYGGFLIGVVVARLLLIDVWSLELVWRIVVFALVGVLLMSTAFIGKKKS